MPVPETFSDAPEPRKEEFLPVCVSPIVSRCKFGDYIYGGAPAFLSPAGLRVITGSVTTTLRSNIIISIPRAHGQNVRPGFVRFPICLIRETARVLDW